ncbi:hypothetical protein QUF80_14465 [Desulfococcaceae bacterium HSG8]|nr:hypothetical protein [Desulfococcaceae bacterium HSG8]
MIKDDLARCMEDLELRSHTYKAHVSGIQPVPCFVRFYPGFSQKPSHTVRRYRFHYLPVHRLQRQNVLK